jgi:heterotetrameric sarcosine oxidase gamma subunit
MLPPCSIRAAAFTVEHCAQSRFDQVPILIYRTAPDRFEVLTERPLARHLWQWLCRAVDDI